MAFERIDEAQWRVFLDRVSRLLVDREAEIEVAGLDLGDQIETRWVDFDGVSFDASEGDVVVHLRDLDHRIVAPRELHVDRDGFRVSQLVVVDGEGRDHFIRLREPLRLESEPVEPLRPA